MSSAPLRPADASRAAAMLAQAVLDQRRVVPCGHETRLRAASTASEDSVKLSSLGLTSGFAHYAGDLVATIPAGMSLREANAALAASGQWLPLDPLSGLDTTIGGLVASNDSGPRRHRFGSPRDLIIGIEVALTSGRVVRAGGRVVKNVAGYDLARLFCGSRGSLGVITSATFKLSPQPHASRTIVCRLDTVSEAAEAALRVAASTWTPSVVEVVAPEPRLLVRFESTERAASGMATAARSLLAAGMGVIGGPAKTGLYDSTPQVVEGEAEARLWSDYYAAKQSADRILKVSVLPTAVPKLLVRLEKICALSARPSLGVIDLFPGTSTDIHAIAALAREHAGHLIVVRGAEERAATSRPSAASVMEAVKRQFDPASILPNPWSAL